MTVNRLLQETDSKELSEWMAYFITKNDEWVADYRMHQQSEEDQSKALMNLFRVK